MHIAVLSDLDGHAPLPSQQPGVVKVLAVRVQALKDFPVALQSVMQHAPQNLRGPPQPSLCGTSSGFLSPEAEQGSNRTTHNASRSRNFTKL